MYFIDYIQDHAPLEEGFSQWVILANSTIGHLAN